MSTFWPYISIYSTYAFFNSPSVFLVEVIISICTRHEIITFAFLYRYFFINLNLCLQLTLVLNRPNISYQKPVWCIVDSFNRNGTTITAFGKLSFNGSHTVCTHTLISYLFKIWWKWVGFYQKAWRKLNVW